MAKRLDEGLAREREQKILKRFPLLPVKAEGQSSGAQPNLAALASRQSGAVRYVLDQDALFS